MVKSENTRKTNIISKKRSTMKRLKKNIRQIGTDFIEKAKQKVTNIGKGTRVRETEHKLS